MRTIPPLPRGRHFALTWGIVSPFGGMTTALLERSRMFASAGAPVDVLTLDPRAGETGLDLPALRAEGVRVRNLYDWVRESPFSASGTVEDVPVLRSGDGVHDDIVDDQTVRRVALGEDGRLREVDHLRADGSVALSERRTGPAARGRVLIARDAAGRPVRRWSRRRDLYAEWLDALTDGARSYLIVDSKTAAPDLLDYRRPHVTTVHVVHGSHRGPTPGSVRSSRSEVFSRLDAFDAVVFATAAQRDDVRALVGRAPHLVTVAHPVPRVAPGASEDADAARSGAVVIARLEPVKRVEHAIEAITRHNARDRARPLSLDVYGSGSCGAQLAAQAEADEHIRLHGHVRGLGPVLESASVLLLTSRSEAFGLVLLEAMAAGCLPIAYDIAYGPGDLIRHRDNGWLVPAGDVDALAAAVAEASALAPGRVQAMRRRARADAARFAPERIAARWSIVLRTAGPRRRAMSALRPLVRSARHALRRTLRRTRRAIGRIAGPATGADRRRR